jgi:ATP-dependent DNA helicase DinG
VHKVSSVSGLTSTETLSSKVDAVFAEDGPLARSIPAFEARTGQQEMATAVARVFERSGVLLAEAGTGTGKTLAYLVPAILSGQRVLISTGTKNLQEQIYFKDIPALRNALQVPFSATYMKGRANYLCLHRLDQINDTTGPAAYDVFLPIVREWAAKTETGDRAELQDLPEDVPFWNDVSATAETCLGTECKRYDECFVTRMRQRAAESDVVIVNHHLLCADAAVRQHAFGEVIPACNHAIIDEAHQLEDVATQYFGVAISTYRIDDLAQDVERLGLPDTAKATEKLRDRGRMFFNAVAYAHRGEGRARGEERLRATPSSLADASEGAAMLAGALDIVESTLKLIRTSPDAAAAVNGVRADLQEQVDALARRADEIRSDLRFLMRANEAEYVYFVEFRGRGVFLRASPIDVSTVVRDLLLDKMRTTVLTSATLTVDGSFDYIKTASGSDALMKSASAPSSISNDRRCCICRRRCLIRDRPTSRLRLDDR